MEKLKNKLYNILGRVVTFIAVYLLMVYLNFNLIILVLDKCITVYR